MQLQLQWASKPHVSPVGQDLVTGWWHIVVVAHVQEESYTGNDRGRDPGCRHGGPGSDSSGAGANPAEITGILTVNLLLRFAPADVERQKREAGSDVLPSRHMQRIPNDNVAGSMRKGPAFRLVRWVDGSNRLPAV